MTVLDLILDVAKEAPHMRDKRELLLAIEKRDIPPTEVNLKQRRLLRGYHYYDSPEGEDLLKKWWYVARWSGYIGAGWGVYWALCQKGYQKNIPIAFEALKYAGPFAAVGSAFVFGSYISCNLRNKKDDELNYLIGGVASGVVIGCWRRKVWLGMGQAVFLGLLAVIWKHAKLNGMKFQPFPDEGLWKLAAFSPWTMRKLDLSLMPEYPGNWTREPKMASQAAEPEVVVKKAVC